MRHIKPSIAQSFNVSVGLLLLLCQIGVFAKEPSLVDFDSAHREQQRAHFLRIESRLYAFSDKELFNELTQLDDYPLKPYLVADKLTQRMRLSRATQIREFLALYDGTPLERRVRKPWLEYLVAKRQFEQFVEFYRDGYGDDMECIYLRNYSGNTESADHMRRVALLWNVGQSQPRECDPLFAQWIKQGGLDEGLILSRIQKAADGGSLRLIPYLTSLLPTDMRYLGELWHEVRKNPNTVSQLSKFTGRFPLVEADIFAYGIKRLIWADADVAISTYEKMKNRSVMSSHHMHEITQSFAIALALDDHPQAETWLIKALEHDPNERTLHWHLAYLVRQQAWHKVKLLIDKLPPQFSNSLQFQYWYARANEQIGAVDVARALYQDLARQRHYYGFLASARLGLEPTMAHQPLDVDESQVAVILESDFVKRAYELRKLGRDYRARLEWYYLQRDLTDTQLVASAKISADWQWHDQTILTLGSLGELDDVEMRFPLAFPELLVTEAEKNNIQPSWSLAIARRESSFMADAVSSADARGLMQVLPSTAQYIENRRISSRDLLKPDVNARLGNKYLRYLLDKLDNNKLLATASYNAGWRKVLEWLPEQHAIDADIWIELIPYHETRNYVKAVLAYEQIYQLRLSASKQPEVFVNLTTTQVYPKT